MLPCPLHLINMILLKPCLCPLHLINLSPFVINGKGIFPSRVAPPDSLSSYGASSCTSKTYKIIIQKKIKNFHFWSRNNSKSLVKIFKGFPWKWFCKYLYHLFFCAHILNSDVLFCNLFHLESYLIGMCLVLECITGFFEY
jgi:hypothetical protein